MAKLALAQNPTCSADLWSTLGDGLYEFGRTAEARSAYLKALSVNAADVRSRYNLAWVYNRENDYPKALAMIAEAMSFDKTGAFRDRLLQKQNEVLARLNARNQREYLLLINLVSKYAKGDQEAKPPAVIPSAVIESCSVDIAWPIPWPPSRETSPCPPKRPFRFPTCRRRLRSATSRRSSRRWSRS